MRKLSVNTFVTLDGVMQAPGGPEEDPTGGFKYGGWSFNYWDDVMGKLMADFMEKPFELLLGRKTYEIFAAHWPFLKGDPVSEKFNATKKYVVSTTLGKLDWINSILIKKDVPGEIKKLKDQNGTDLQVHGSGNLVQTLLKNDLVDELNLWTFPVLVGKGKKLFAEGTKASNLKLVQSTTSTTGVLISIYKPAGELKTGSFAVDNPASAELERRKKLALEEKLA